MGSLVLIFVPITDNPIVMVKSPGEHVSGEVCNGVILAHCQAILDAQRYKKWKNLDKHK
jgi:hypothetical protein